MRTDRAQTPNPVGSTGAAAADALAAAVVEESSGSKRPLGVDYGLNPSPNEAQTAQLRG